MKNTAITAAAVCCALLTVLGEIGFRLLAFAWSLATEPAPAAPPAPLEPAPPLVLPLAAAAAPAGIEAPPLADLTVVQLRSMARARLGASRLPSGALIRSARRAALLAALGG